MKTELQTMTIEEWEERYRPVFNPKPDAGWERWCGDDLQGGLLWETYGAEHTIVYLMDEHHVWTWLDGDEGTVLVNGRMWVNRIGYVITELPWHDSDVIDVKVD